MIGGCMKCQVIAVSPTITAPEAAHIVASNHVGTLPVVDDLGLLVGVVRLEELLQVFMPDFVALMDSIVLVHDFGALETLRPQDVPGAAQLTMRDLMQPPVAVEQTCGLLRAFATMTEHEIRDLPVVDTAGALVGIASRADIAATFLAPWTQNGPQT
jgi:CBS domain-containing protein